MYQCNSVPFVIYSKCRINQFMVQPLVNDHQFCHYQWNASVTLSHIERTRKNFMMIFKANGRTKPYQCQPFIFVRVCGAVEDLLLILNWPVCSLFTLHTPLCYSSPSNYIISYIGIIKRPSNNSI